MCIRDSHCTVACRLRIDVHDNNDNDDNDNAWYRGPLWPHGMGPKNLDKQERFQFAPKRPKPVCRRTVGYIRRGLPGGGGEFGEISAGVGRGRRCRSWRPSRCRRADRHCAPTDDTTATARRQLCAQTTKYLTRNAWQSLACSPPGIAVSPPGEQ